MDHDGGHGAIELGAALILVVGGTLLTALTIRTRRARPGPAASASSGGQRSLVLMLATLSLGAAAIHLVAAPSHFTEIGDLAMGFVLAAAFQAGWARSCLAGPSGRTVAVGIAGNLAIIAAWAWTRTIGLPLAEGGLAREVIGFPDGAAVAFELLLVMGLIARMIVARLGSERVRHIRPAARTVGSIAVVPVVGLVLILTSLATVAIATGLDHGPPAGAPGMPATMDHAARH